MENINCQHLIIHLHQLGSNIRLRMPIANVHTGLKADIAPLGPYPPLANTFIQSKRCLAEQRAIRHALFAFVQDGGL